MCLFEENFPNFLNFTSISLHFPDIFLPALHQDCGLADGVPPLVQHHPPDSPLDGLQDGQHALQIVIPLNV